MAGPKLFSEATPNLQLAWDATSLKEFAFCPRRYKLNIIDGHRSIGGSIHLTFGILYHSALETFDELRAVGELPPDEIELRAFNRLIEESKDWKSPDNVKNRFNLLRSVAWYMQNFRNDPLKVARLGAEKKPAVELSFAFDAALKSKAGEDFIFCGHLDGVAQMDDTYYIRERKTTGSALSSYYFGNYNNDIQVQLYSVGAELLLSTPIAGVVIDAVQVGVSFSRFARHTVTLNAEQKDEVLTDVRALIMLAEQCALMEYWPRTPHNCNRCSFMEVCSSTPAIRESLLKTNFTTEHWNPLTLR